VGTVANGTVIGTDGTTWQASAGMGSGSITVTDGTFDVEF